MTGRTKATVLALIIFAAGVVLGGLLTFRLVQVSFPGPGPGPGAAAGERVGPGRNGVPDRIMRDLSERLGLDGDQQEKLQEILRHTREQMVSINQEANQKQQGLRRQTREQIRTVLSPDQAQQFERLLSRMERNWRANRRGGNRPRNPERIPERDQSR